ncbi:MAG: transaldolase [Myxococcota bacterium]
MKLLAGGLRVKLFMDGADLDAMERAYRAGIVQGFTTNPTLMRKAHVTDYEAFARAAISSIPDLPISFEVFSDDFDVMAEEARTIASWGGTTYVKIPITNTRGESSSPLIEKLSSEGLRINVTAVTHPAQVRAAVRVLNPGVPSIVSVFAGRIADTGVDPVPVMANAVEILRENPRAELLWASPRELLNLFQAEQVGCHILTATDNLLAKLHLIGKNLGEYSLETVQMFHDDARKAGYKII